MATKGANILDWVGSNYELEMADRQISIHLGALTTYEQSILAEGMESLGGVLSDPLTTINDAL